MTSRRYTPWALWLVLGLLPGNSVALAQAPPQHPASPPADSGPIASQTDEPFDQKLPNSPSLDPRTPGRITGTVADQTGAVVAGAWVRLTSENQTPDQQVLTGDDGQFSLANIAPGPFHLTISAAGFAPQSFSGNLHAGENFTVPPLALIVAATTTELRVVPTPAEVAEDQIKDQEKQRVLGLVPNFYVSYVYNAVPLTSRQKFQLAWKTSVDPVSFALNGVIAGVQQSQNNFSAYGQGAQGYGKRYGAAYADFVSGTFIGSAILPSLLKQDPRYFYKGTGSKGSRILYALANAVICKGDNGRWQPNYSNIGGNIAASALSTLYYPANEHNSAAFAFESAAFGVGAIAATNLLQEFLIRKLIPGVSSHQSSKTPSTKGKFSFTPGHEGD
jgi:Carboxypeptidase regulatory-like domain